jgi:uncharacterized protein YjdB
MTHTMKLGGGLLRLSIIAAALAALVSCSDVADPSAPLVPVALVDVEPEAVLLQPGDTIRLQATARSSNGSILHGRAVTWSSGDTLTATVSATGLVTARRAGAANIAASIDGRTGTVQVEIEEAEPVVHSVQVAPEEVTVAPGEMVHLAAAAVGAEGQPLDVEIAWSTGNVEVAVVSPSGVVRAVAPGTVQIRAEAMGQYGTAVVTVAAPPLIVARIEPTTDGVVTLHIGDTRQLGVRAYAADGAEIVGRPVGWTSDDESVATVTAAGTLTAREFGTATITATVEGVTAQIAVDVRSLVARVDMDPGAAALPVGEHVRITASARTASGQTLQRPITFTSGNQAVATVDQTGLVTARGEGTATIVATVDGQQGRTDIRVVEWTQRELLTVDGRDLPTTLFTRTWTDDNGVSHTAVIEARSGSFRTAETGLHSGRWEQRFQVAIHSAGTIPHVGEYVNRGDYTYDFITQRFTLNSWTGVTLSAEVLAGEKLRITGSLEAGTPALVLDYSSR